MTQWSFGCERCDRISHVRQLVRGGFHTSLCNGCWNDLHVAFMEKFGGLYERLEAMDKFIASPAGSASEYDDFLNQETERTLLDNRAFEWAKEFVAAKIKREGNCETP